MKIMPMSSCVAEVAPLACAACEAPGEFAHILFVWPLCDSDDS